MDTSLTDGSDYMAYLLGSDTSSTFDTNAGVNPAAAAATSPIVASANGTSSVTSSGWAGLGSFLTGLAPVATSVLKTATAPATVAAANTAAATTPAAIAGTSNTTLYIIAGVVVAAILGFILLRRR
jgi:LPXTG-motif cell wall-anchored protein